MPFSEEPSHASADDGSAVEGSFFGQDVHARSYFKEEGAFSEGQQFGSDYIIDEVDLAIKGILYTQFSTDGGSLIDPDSILPVF